MLLFEILKSIEKIEETVAENGGVIEDEVYNALTQLYQEKKDKYFAMKYIIDIWRDEKIIYYKKMAKEFNELANSYQSKSDKLEEKLINLLENEEDEIINSIGEKLAIKGSKFLSVNEEKIDIEEYQELETLGLCESWTKYSINKIAIRKILEKSPEELSDFKELFEIGINKKITIKR